ncbi:MAG TPA: hypothetical protein VMF04_04965 [Thermoplasmata archaeon]|nr:hypothetical protein [Thermoplasmata archaeon]
MVLLVAAAFVVILASLATSWWGYSASTGGATESVQFLPGSNYNFACSGHCAVGSASNPYASIPGPLNTIYEGVLGLLIAAAAMVGLAALFLGLSALGRRPNGVQPFWTRLFLLLSPILLLVAVLWTAAGQPGAFPSSGDTFVGSGTNGASPSNSFWGSSSTDAASWGAGIGWYLAVVGVVLLFVVLLVVMVLSRQAATAPEPERRTRNAVPAAPVVPKGYTAPPVVTPHRSPVTRPPVPRATPPPEPVPATVTAVVPDVATPVMVACPECGTQNLVKSRVCSYCQRSLRPAPAT